MWTERSGRIPPQVGIEPSTPSVEAVPTEPPPRAVAEPQRSEPQLREPEVVREIAEPESRPAAEIVWHEPTKWPLLPLRKLPPAEPASASAPPAKASAAIAAQLLADNPRPDYPADAQLLGHEGVVEVRCTIDAQGIVQRVELHKPTRYPSLNREALRAVRQWRFLPARRDGQPIAWEQVVCVEFRLD